MELQERIKQLASDYYSETVYIRRHLHSNPELSFHEYETSKFIQKKLNEYKIPFQSDIANTGVVGLIKGKNPNARCIALRADIDALPIEELNSVDYRSKNSGVMHACGHDVHTASLLGAAKILNILKDHWEGTIKLIFQPAEEKFPGGALSMIQAGVLEDPKVEKIIAQHVSPELNQGVVGMCPGMFMASADEIYISVIGRGGHAALPDLILNPIVLASRIIDDLYKYFDNISDIPSVFSIGSIIGGNIGNVVPEEVKIQGTFRSMNEEYRMNAHQKIHEICQTRVQEEGGECNVEIKVGYPFLKNDIPLTISCMDYAKSYLRAENVLQISQRMTAEDFAYYTHHIPSCFYRLGVGFKEEPDRYLHSGYFDIDEKALELSIGMFAWLAINI